MSAVFLKIHLGAGDLVICNGLIRVLAERHGRIIIPAKPHNESTARWMFSDDKRIEVCRVENDNDMLKKASEWDSIGIGLWSNRGLIPERWSEAFYQDAAVPLECRWTCFNLPWSELPEVTPQWVVFWHDDPKRKYCISLAVPKHCVYMPSANEPFQNHIRPLQAAAEIHVIDSCFLCLADSIETNAKRHVLHAYATAHDPYKKFGPPTLRKNWEILI